MKQKLMVGIIFPHAQRAHIVGVDDVAQAERAAGLMPGTVDHGTVAKGIAVVVSEYGLFEAPERTSYFRIEGCPNLLAGPAVLYAFDQSGVSVDLPSLPRVVFLPDRRAVERAIGSGHIKRPHIGVGDDVIWRWPGPAPSDEARERLMSKSAAPGVTVIDGDTFIITEPPERK